MNLITNSRDALQERSRHRTDPSIIRVVVSSRVRLGDTWIVFRVTDNGDGIDPAIVDRIFDPFFTTKAARNGMGLGLSISHGIAETHGGTLVCASEPGVGTTFELEIPCLGALDGSAALRAVGS